MTASELNLHFPEKNKWPTFVEIEDKNKSQDESAPASSTENIFEVTCIIPADLSWFNGHFPEQPVLPGVVQVNWASQVAQRVFDCAEFRGVNSLKFTTMILPNTQVTLYLTANPEKHSIKFSYKSDETLFSSGTLIFSSH